MSFLDSLQKNIEEINSLCYTENGALGYSTTGKKLLDMNFDIPNYRRKSEAEIISDFETAYADNEMLAVLWMMFVRDIRGGVGERRLFRILFRYMCEKHTDVATKLVALVPEYGRWDDIVYAAEDTPVWGTVTSTIKAQILKDVADFSDGKPISLCAKWMPSERTSCKNTRNLARKLAQGMGLHIKNYNRILSTLRKYLRVVETQMSAKKWSEIDYSAVPSYANLRYNNAFLRNDEARRREYLEALSKGETKINSSTLFPHDIVMKYAGYNEDDPALEGLWKALPDMGGLDDTIVVADGSGSMYYSPNKPKPIHVAHGLAIYCAEHCRGEFKDKFITFSHRPQFVHLPEGSLRDKIQYAMNFDEMANTNIEAVFDIILETAIKSKSKQEDLPKNILIVSDMEFDMCATVNGERHCRPDNVLFNVIKKKYEDAGYQVPRLVFWNVASRTSTIPIKENDLGVTLISGYSLNLFKMIQNGETDPYINLVRTITSERYAPVLKALGAPVPEE